MEEQVKESTTGNEWPERTLAGYLGIYIRGMLMGAADIVPGVSGGTMAFITGIYEELINSIKTIGSREFIDAALHFRIREMFQLLNWKFLFALAFGILTAVFLFAGLLEYLLVNEPVYLWSFFFGLIVAAIIVIGRTVGHWGIAIFVALAAGAIGTYFLVGAVPAQTPDTWWFLILTGALASCAMILPGISGAYILVLLGKYEAVLGAVNDRDFFTLGLIAFGAAIGLVTFAQVLSWLFKRYHDMTIAVLIGLLIGSLRKIWPWKVDTGWVTDGTGAYLLDSHGDRVVTTQANVLPDLSTQAGVTEAAIAAGLAILGVAVVLLIEYVAERATQASPSVAADATD